MIADMLRCDIDALVVAPCDSWDCGWFRTAVEEKGILVFTTDTAALDCAIPYIGSDHQKIGRADPELFFFPLQAGSRHRFFGLSDRLPSAIRMPPPDHKHRHDQGDCGRCGLS